MQVGPFTPTSELGRGALGTVLRARDPQGREVALKLLHAQAAASPQRRKRFLQEARALSRVRHRHLVGVVDVGEAPSGPWIAMELVAGETLAARLSREGPLPLATALRLGEELASGVAALHAAGLVHRDINPRNVLLRAPGAEAVLGDLGLVQDLDQAGSRATLEGRALGTPGYWPPEQARGELARIGPPSDVYALGATLYAALTGQPPFQVETIQDALRVLDEDPAPPSDLRPELPPALVALVMRCLARRPEDRVSSAAHLLDALRVLRRAPVPPSDAGPTTTWIAVAVLLLAALVSGGLLLRGQRPPPVASSPASAPAPAQREAPAGGADAPAAAAPVAPDPPPARRSSELLARVRSLIQSGDRVGAYAALEEMRALEPDHAEAAVLLATLLSSDGRRAEAYGLIERAVAAHPDQARPIGLRGLLRMEDDDPVGAEADLTRALALDASDKLSWHNRACARLAQGRPRDALDDEDHVQQLAPDYAPGLYIRARALQELGRWPEAEQALERALALRPRYPAVWLLKARLRLAASDREGARECALRAQTVGRPGNGVEEEARAFLEELGD